MLKLFLMIIIGLGAAWYFPDSRAMIKDKGAPVLNPMYVKLAEAEMTRVVEDLQLWDGQGREFPTSRNFETWMARRYQSRETLYDPWGGAYYMTSSRSNFVIFSNGPDLLRGTEDDIQVSGLRTTTRGR